MDLEAELTDDETFTETSLDTTLCQAFLEQIGALWQVDEGSNWSVFFKPVPNFYSITFDKYDASFVKFVVVPDAMERDRCWEEAFPSKGQKYLRLEKTLPREIADFPLVLKPPRPLMGGAQNMKIIKYPRGRKSGDATTCVQLVFQCGIERIDAHPVDILNSSP